MGSQRRQTKIKSKRAKLKGLSGDSRCKKGKVVKWQRLKHLLVKAFQCKLNLNLNSQSMPNQHLHLDLDFLCRRVHLNNHLYLSFQTKMQLPLVSEPSRWDKTKIKLRHLKTVFNKNQVSEGSKWESKSHKFRLRKLHHSQVHYLHSKWDPNSPRSRKKVN